jgi:hypothetical protein
MYDTGAETSIFSMKTISITSNSVIKDSETIHILGSITTELILE